MPGTFGRLLQLYRTKAGLSQEQLAERAGVSTNAISSLERGLRLAPHSATLDRLVAALELDDRGRVEMEEAAKLARAHRIQAQGQQQSDFLDETILHNLPPELTSFVDREKEVPEIKELLRSHRLVTVVGAGGAGKTRCAIKIAAETLGVFSDGVWVAELALISDPALVATTIARTLKVQEVPNRPLLETVIAFLKRKHLLLLLDNCEHVIDEARRVGAAIMHDCSDVSILATSRESLSIAGEQTYRMPSLPVPTLDPISAEEMSQYGAVRLFGDRAFAADNRFKLTVDSASHVADICRRLDGIPLAIELAAARVSTLSPQELAQRLDERFRLLTGGDPSALPRHRTMRALIDWSYDLLSDDERRLFRKLSVFAGGFTLGTATAVCAAGVLDEIAVLELLSSLVAKSLVQAGTAVGETRYRLLESTRQYARQKLGDDGEETATAHAHARAFLDLAECLCSDWETEPDRAWDARAEPELENFRAALSWSFGASGDVLLGHRLACALLPVWFTFAQAEGRRWMRYAQQDTAQTPSAITAALDLAEAQLAGMLGERRLSLPPAERALARYREVGDAGGIALAQRQIGTAFLFLGRVQQGEMLLREALEVLQALGKRRSAIVAMNFSATARLLVGDFAAARQGFAEARAAARYIGAERFAGYVALSLAEMDFRSGDGDEALRLANEALAVVRASGDTHGVARALHNVAAYLVALRRFEEALTAARDALNAACEAQFPVGVAWALQHLAAIAALRSSLTTVEDRRRAACILGYVEGYRGRLEAVREYAQQQEYDAMMQALRNALGEDELSRLMAMGSTWTEDQAFAEAMSI